MVLYLNTSVFRENSMVGFYYICGMIFQSMFLQNLQEKYKKKYFPENTGF